MKRSRLDQSSPRQLSFQSPLVKNIFCKLEGIPLWLQNSLRTSRCKTSRLPSCPRSLPSLPPLPPWTFQAPHFGSYATSGCTLYGVGHPLEQPLGHHQGFAIKVEESFCTERTQNLLLYHVYFRGISSIFSWNFHCCCTCKRALVSSLFN